MALQRGDTGPLVLAAQVLLRVPRTGTFDAITELAVVQLQQKFGLPVNGILDTAEYTAARHASSHETAGADPINPAAITGAPWLLKATDSMLGALTLAASALGLPGTAALKIPSGPLLLTPEAGAVERLVDKLYLTISTGVRKPIALVDSALTSGRVPFVTTDGRLLDDAKLIWDNVAKFLAVGQTYKFVVLGDNGANGELPANHALMGSYLGSLAFFASTTTGGAAYQVICGYFNGSSIKSAWEINNTSGGALGHLKLMRSGGYVSIGGGTQLSKIVVYTPSLTPGLVSAGAGVEQTFAVAGLTTGDTISVNPPGAAIFAARVTAADTLGLTFVPPPAGSYTPPAGVYRILATRS